MSVETGECRRIGDVWYLANEPTMFFKYKIDAEKYARDLGLSDPHSLVYCRPLYSYFTLESTAFDSLINKRIVEGEL